MCGDLPESENIIKAIWENSPGTDCLLIITESVKVWKMLTSILKTIILILAQSPMKILLD